MSAPTDAFEEVKILDNFYQTSSYFPMPVVLVSTVSESGQTNLGPYSLCFPHIISGRHAMMLIARGSSNTATNIRRTGLAALSFIPDERAYLENCVVLGFPGETTEQKMKNSIFTLMPSLRQPDPTRPERFPELVAEAVQVFECRWDASHPHETQGLEHHYLLDIEKIVMKKHWQQALIAGGEFPQLPIDYGYRDSQHFWFARGRTPFAVDIPKGHGVSSDAVLFQANRIDPEVTWEPAACAELVDVPRIFLKTVLTSCVDGAKAKGVRVITPAFLHQLRDKRAAERPPSLLDKLRGYFSRGPERPRDASG
jgi:flavin reductase (DIM6/NTAB) family NADH-FMN oxidoreductase RutF